MVRNTGVSHPQSQRGQGEFPEDFMDESGRAPMKRGKERGKKRSFMNLGPPSARQSTGASSPPGTEPVRRGFVHRAR